MKNVLVALDGSAISEGAQGAAIELAREHEATVTAVGVVDVPEITHPEPVPIGGGAFKQMKEETLMAQARERIDEFLERFERRCREEGVDFSTVCREGDPHEEIALEARCHDLIVIGRETYFHFATREEKGDTLRQLAHSMPRPLLSTPAEKRNGNGILVSYDDSLPVVRALQLYLLLDPFSSDEIRVLAVDEEQSKAEEKCRRAVAFLERHRRRVEARPVASKQRPSDVILEETDAYMPRLLVMGSFGHNGLRERLFGTTTDRLLFDADCPVPVFLYH